jgi:xanthine dehydrogenase accessory factor
VSQEIIAEIAASQGPVAIAMVVGVRGSAPRHLGTMMLFKPDGRTIGSVGGGRVELEAAKAASRCLDSGSSLGIEIEMVGKEATGSAPICGGNLQLLIEYVADPSVYAAAAAALARGAGIVLAVGIVPPGESRVGGLFQGAFDRSGSPLAGEAGDVDRAGVAEAVSAELGVAIQRGTRVYIHVKSADRLLVLGGGHIGLALARFGVELGFRVFVGDERPEYTSRDRFPAAVETIHGTYREIIGGFEFGDSAYVVVATPSHQSDLECVRAVMGRGYRYAGFVGSRRKTGMILERLVEEGFDRTEVESLRAPIGIDIGAETPGEIAVSIMTEIVAARRNSPALAIMDKDRIRRRS